MAAFLLKRSLLIFALALGLTVASSPSRAIWSGPCSANFTCPTAYDACAQFANMRLSPLNGTYWKGVRLYCETDYYIDDYSAPSCPVAGEHVCLSSEDGCCSSSPQDCGDCDKQDGDQQVGNPVSVVTGNNFEKVVDFETAGPNKLSFVRYYNSQTGVHSSLGIGWRSNYDRRLVDRFMGAEKWLYRADGRSFGYNLSGGAYYPQRPDTKIGLQAVAGGFEAIHPDDTVETYDGLGLLVSILKRGGYEQTLAYDTDGFLESVTDSYGRQLTFTVSGGRPVEMTDPDGNVFGYTYGDAHPGALDRLEKVAFPDDTPLDPLDNPEVVYLYEDSGQPFALTGILDENGDRYATWAYDSGMRATMSEHAGGAGRVDIVYDDANNTRTVTNALGKQTVYQLAPVAGREKIVDVEGLASQSCAGSFTSQTYDSLGFPETKTDRNGNLTAFINFPNGLPQRRTDAVGTPEERATTYLWHAAFRVPTEISEPERKTTFSYDTEGRLIQKTLEDRRIDIVPYATIGTARSWTYSYTAEGLLASVDGPHGGTTDVTTYDYDLLGNLTKVTNALGQETQITAHNGRGLPLTLVDANGIATDLAYDERGRLLSRTVNPGPDQAVTGFTYDAAGQITRVTLPDGANLNYVHDAAHRLGEVNNDLGEKIVYTLDDLGNRTQEDVYSAAGLILRTRSRVFDELGRLMREIGAGAQETNYGYDLEDNLATVIDPVGAVTSHAYDALNRLVESTDDLNGITSYGYDAQDNLTGVTDPRGLTTTYTRSGLGEVIQTESPDTGFTLYHYDDAGNLSRQENARGAVIEYDYDALNRVTANRFPADPAQDVAYGYDDPTAGRHGIGRLTSVTDATGWSAFHYDARGNLALESRNIGGVTYDTAYAYDAADRLTGITYPSGRIVTYQRDPVGRVSGVTTQADELAPIESLASNLDYTAFGPLTALDLGNGMATDLTYDQDYRLSGLVTGDGVSSVQDLVYGYDLASNITSIDDGLDITRSQAFLYDDLHRLTQGTGLYGQIDYAYDPVGNRTDRTVTLGANVTSETSTLDAASNRLMSVDDGTTVRSLAYNGAGDLESDTRGLSVFDLDYDQAGRLASTAEDGTATVNSLYNAKGERCVMVAGGMIEHSLYDREGRLIARFDAGAGSPAAVAGEIVLDNGDGGTAGVGTWDAASILSGYLGADYLTNQGSSADSYSWTPTLAAAGPHIVKARWPVGLSDGTAVTYQVSHDGGLSDVVVDQTAGGGQWRTLGTFEMTPGLGQGVTLSGADGATHAYVEATSDNLDSGTSAAGSWPVSTWAGGGTPFVLNYAYHATGTGTNSFTWPLSVPQDGSYRIHARWSAAASHASNAKYTVEHALGSTTVAMDQTANGGAWVALGDFELTAAGPHSVTLSDQATGSYVIADAIKAVKLEAVSPAHDAATDDPAGTVVGSWPISFWTGGGLIEGGGFRYHATGTGANTYTWPVSVPADGSYQVYASWSAYSNRAPDAPYTIEHAGGSTTVTADQRVNGGRWNLLGGFTFTAAGPHSITLSDAATGTYVIADAVRIVADTVESPVVAADAVSFERPATPSFPVASSSLLDEMVYLGGRPIAMVDGGTLYYVHTDHLGTPQKMTDASGAVVWDAVYRPFGEAESITGSAQNDLRFPGQLYDAETGFHYNYFRDYAPALGRYIESDPIGLRGGLNTYLYAAANSVNRTDESGLFTPGVHYEITVGAGLAAGLGRPSAAGLANLVMLFDFQPDSQEPFNSYQHSMCSPGQDPAEAAAATEAYIQSQLQTCTPQGLANAIHALQDGYAGGHQGCQEWGGGTPSVGHIIQDAFPGEAMGQAQAATTSLMQKFQEMCPCGSLGQ